MIENENAIIGMKKILSKFSNQDVLALCGTVTQGLLKNKIHLREDAIEAIIKYSTDSSSFLKRKLITRTHLFEYAHDTGIEITLPSTKDDLIDNIIQYWSSEDCSRVALLNVNIDNTISSNSSVNNALYSRNEAECTSLCIQEHNHQIATGIVSCISPSELELLALQFSEWFYKLMNSNQVISMEHLYSDASIQIKLVSNEMTMNEEVTNNAEEAVNLLYKIKQEHGLYFNPNLNKEGTKAKMDPHGLVMVMACGTLHINNVISGVFEQMFGLARDPFSDNNWKIKSSMLILRSTDNVKQMPRLCDGELLQIRES